MPLPDALREAIERVLACPACGASLVADEAEEAARCVGCALRYPVIDGALDLLSPRRHDEPEP